MLGKSFTWKPHETKQMTCVKGTHGDETQGHINGDRRREDRETEMEK